MKLNDRNKLIRYLLIIIAVLLPLLTIGLHCICFDVNITDFRPSWGDENWWWQQANAVIEYGRPLGYWGYNGGNAKIGTFATWGPAMVMPYALFGRIFGWQYHSYIWANVFYIGMATFIFIILTKLPTKNILLLILCNLFIVVKNYNLTTAMAECARYSLGILAVAFLWYLYVNDQCHWGFKYVFLPIYLIYITQAYMIFGVFHFFYMLCILQNRRIYTNVLASGISAAIFVLVSKKAIGLFTSPYNSDKLQLTYIEKVIKSLETIKGIILKEDTFFSCFLLGYIVFTFVISIYMIIKWKKLSMDDKVIYITSAGILLVFFFGHMVFYSSMTVWTFIRGLTVGIMVVVFLLCISKNRTIIYIFLLCAIVGIPTYDNVYKTFFNENRYQNIQWKESVEETKKELNEFLVVNEHTHNPWENTVATYSVSGLNLSLSIPQGMAINAMTNGSPEIQAKYAVVGKLVDIEANDEKVLQLEQNGYIKKHDSKRMTILVNEVIQWEN